MDSDDTGLDTLAHLRQQAAADFQSFIDTFQKHTAVAVGIFLQPTNRRHRNQCIAVYAQEITGEFFLQRFRGWNK